MKVNYGDLLISRAMENLKMISFKFDGKNIRLVEPHYIIEHIKTNVRYLMAFQIDGGSVSKNGWKIFILL